MNTAVISIGSNEDSEKNVEYCKQLLDSIFTTIHYSDTSITKPYGTQYRHDFLNQLALTETEMDLSEVVKTLKLLEKKMGREVEDKNKGLVKIDIDLIKWNDTIVKEEDWQRNYVTDLLPSLYKNFTSH